MINQILITKNNINLLKDTDVIMFLNKDINKFIKISLKKFKKENDISFLLKNQSFLLEGLSYKNI